MDLKLKGLKALVTGGTRGIGRAIAFGLASEGVHVGICARDSRAVDETAKDLSAKDIHAWGQAIDVADGAALEAWVKTGAKVLGGLDILVTNASALADGATPEEFRRSFDVDVMHTVNAATAAVPFMEKAGGGSITAISSVSGSEIGGYDSSPYGAMKAALNFHVKTLARHLAPKNIRANTVSPGTTYFEGGYWHKVEVGDPKTFAYAMEHNPMGRMATVEDIANMVVFLSCPKAGFVTGANIVVDGGLTRRVQN